MRYKLVAEVVGVLFLSDKVVFDANGFDFEFIPDEKGMIKQISVSKEVPKDRVERFKSTIEPGKGRSVATLKIGGDNETHEELVDQLQMIESVLAFSSGAALKRIKWETPKQEYIPETLEEQQMIAVTGLDYYREYTQQKTSLTSEFLVGLIQFAPMYDELRIAKAFWREGMNYFNSFQYVQAFYQFYYVVEDFYAHGKTGKRPVLTEFQKSAEFQEICEKTLSQLFEMDRHRENLVHFFHALHCEPTPIGLQELLFEMRGSLHHFSGGSPRLKGTPFNQKEFESIALLLMHLVTLAIGYREAAISQKLNSVQ